MGASQGAHSPLKAAVGGDVKGKMSVLPAGANERTGSMLAPPTATRPD